jgi:hypothetical protein
VWLLASGPGCAAGAPTIVDEPSVRLEAELNLHYKTFSEVELTETYMDRWLHKYDYLPGREVMSDQELFRAIDCERVGLESVKAAVVKGDYQQAHGALAEYFRSRVRPCPVAPGALAESRRQEVLARADAGLRHPNFPRMAWPRDKFGRGCKDARWNWVSHLYYAHRYTGEIDYFRHALEMFSFWYETVRPPAGTPRIWLSASFIENPWCSHQAASKLHTLLLFDDLLAGVDFDRIPAAERIPLYKSVIEHGRFLIAVNPGYRSGNIQIGQMLWLLEAGIYFPELIESSDWVALAWQNLLKHAWLDLFPDGGHYERATAYNNAVIRFWRRILELSRVAGLATPDWLEPKLRDAQEWTVKVYTPLLNMPPVGDSSMGEEGFALPYLIDGALLFPCPEFLFFVKDHSERLEARAQELFGEGASEALARLRALEPAEPEYTSVLLRDTGWAVMRSGWDREALYMLFDYGSNEPWHCHRDGLGFSIFAYGEPLITDCGHAGSYESDRSKQWYKETVSHNVVAINGMSQRKVTDGTCKRWVTSASADYVEAIHDGYKYLGAYCRRKITFVKPTYWIITDNLTDNLCQTTGYQECQWLAHFQPTSLTVDEETLSVRTNNARANVLLVPAHPADLNLVRSAGWMVTPQGEVDDAPHIGYGREGDLPIDYEVVVYPYEGQAVPEVTVERLDLGADAWRCKGLKIVTPEGVDYYLEALAADYYVVIAEETAFRTYGTFSFDGEMALLRERDGELASAFLVGGTGLQRDGLPLATCSGEIDWLEVLFSGNTASAKGVFTGKVIVTLPRGGVLEVECG